MSQHTNTYDRFATLFSYPSQDFKKNIESLRKNWITEFALQPSPSDDTKLAQLNKAKSHLESFINSVQLLTTVEMEELYTRLHAVSRSTHRRGILETDLSFLAGGPEDRARS